MKNEKTRWRLSQRDIGHLSMALKPVRTCQEAAEILGLSPGIVRQIENSALRKIVRALASLEKTENPNHERH
jgi:DNA-directed RNA polymerase sigma subunit (sigma70/sigma32)